MLAARSWWYSKHVGSSHVAARCRNGKSRPLLASICQSHVCALNFFAGIPLFEVQIQPDQCEGNPDRLRVLAGMLRRPGIDNQLVDKLGVPEAQRVGAKLEDGLYRGIMRRGSGDELAAGCAKSQMFHEASQALM